MYERNRNEPSVDERFPRRVRTDVAHPLLQRLALCHIACDLDSEGAGYYAFCDLVNPWPPSTALAEASVGAVTTKKSVRGSKMKVPALTEVKL